ncbi:unnamed protein product [Gongylonema pulchrum]|uniref:Oxidoreductase n=1 Tax=Gongylonema pulchrum TaxID=637853 RepID=A0A183EER1_9BILA|nr:unnamed protein product [Gongylonema pulchrum]
MSKVKDEFGRLDAVISCAGISFNHKTYSFHSASLTQKAAAWADLNKVFRVADETQVKNGMSKVKDEFGRLDAVISCAGISFNHKTYSFHSASLTQKAAAWADLNKVFRNPLLHLCSTGSQSEVEEVLCQ